MDTSNDGAGGPAFRALALQTRCRSVTGIADPSDARSIVAANIDRIRGQIAASIGFIGPDTRLVVLPEYSITGHPLGESIEAWTAKAALDPGGAEYTALASIADELGIYLATNAYETDRHFSDLYFQASCIFGPTGDTVLRYRRLNSMYSPTPHDVWDRYLDHYGIDAVFPVADTALGRLAAIASEEILFPELARCLALRGAEVFVHSTSEVGSPLLTPKDVAKRARAIENLAYVVSANSAGIEGSPVPAESTDGGSQIIDFEGRVLAEAGTGETVVANASVDVGALRRARRRPGMGNLLARTRTELYASTYAGTTVHAANGLASGEAPERSWFMATQRQVIERLVAAGVLA